MKNKTVFKTVAAVMMSLSLLTGCEGSEGQKSRGSIGDTAEEEEVTPTEAPKPTQAEATPTEAPTPTPVPEAVAPDYRQLELSSYQMSNSYYDEDLEATIASVSVTHMELLDDDLPKLKKSIDDYIADNERSLNGSDFDGFVEEAKGCAEVWGGPVELYANYYTRVARADTVVTSLITDYDDFHGGAHGLYYTFPVNFDSVTGKELNINDVINPDWIDVFPQILEEKLLEEYDPGQFFNPDSLAADIEEAYHMTGDYDFSLGYEGMTVYFQIYALAPYASGSQAVFLRYEDYPELVNEKYTDCSYNYFIDQEAVGISMPNYAVKAETYGYLTDKGDDWMFKNLVIYLDKIQYKEEVYAYDAEFYFACIGSETYMFVNLHHEDDYQNINVYYIDTYNRKIEKKCEFDGGFYNSIPSDPMNFRIYQRTDMFSTYSIYKYYYIGRDGEPVTTDDYFLADVDPQYLYLTAKEDISVDIREKQDNTAVEYIEYHDTVKKGQKLYFYATDNEQWAEFILDDGRIARITLDKPGWPMTINGVDIEELFDGIMFAG